MDFVDRLLTCSDCGDDFIFTAGEQLFFFDKQFKNDPKRCKPCKSKRAAKKPGAKVTAAALLRTETRTECSACGLETTVPFKPTQGRPVLCRQCFQTRNASLGAPGTLDNATSVLHAATAELMAGGTTGEHVIPPVEPVLRRTQA